MRIFFQILSCRIVGFLAFRRLPRWLLSFCIRQYARVYRIPMDLYDVNIRDYRCFNDFFTRKFKPGIRTFTGDPASPVDASIYASGPVSKQTILQIKGQLISVQNLLEKKDNTIRSFWSFYLAPGDYHCVHAPCDMTIQSVTHIPGAFYSVSPRIAHKKPVFLKNERMVIQANTESGTIYLVMIAALNVGNISLKVLNDKTPSHRQKAVITDDFPGQVYYKQGDKIGSFNFGSAVVLLTPQKAEENYFLRKVQLGDPLR